MNTYINYVIEANLGLITFFVLYKILLSRETNFKVLRLLLVSGVVLSLIFPMFTLNVGQTSHIPSLSYIIPETWLPEVVISIGQRTASDSVASVNQFWNIVSALYLAGVIIFAFAVIYQLVGLTKLIRNSATYRYHNLHIIESNIKRSTFSFFNFIFIGEAESLSEQEKKQIIQHELVHASQWHSLDILLLKMMQILFWFNPLIAIIRNHLVQLHEFEADARAVENQDVNKYCSLLAKVALRSADFTLANHFNQSLTVKRIEMMKKHKSKIKSWKFAALIVFIPLIFFVMACQDQIANEIENSSITQTSFYPKHVQADVNQYMNKHPDAKLSYFDGIPEEVDKLISADPVKSKVLKTYYVKENGTVKKGVLMNDVVQYAVEMQSDDKVFTVVEQLPEFLGGQDAMFEFIKENLLYPAAAREQGKEGTVYISMVINENGSVSDAKVIRGVHPLVDEAARKVVASFPNWIPGKQDGKAVKVKFVVPIRFAING